MEPSEKLARLQLIRSSRIGPITFSILLARYGSAKAAIAALPDLARRGGAKFELASLASVEDELARAGKYGARIIVRGEEAYPDSLEVFDDAPGAITLMGHGVLLEKPAVAIVGSRNASANAMAFCKRMAAEIGEAGYVIISGLARGIDAAAHEGGLAGGTIAVLGGGIDRIYPRENEKLYHRIGEEGLLVAEMPFGMQPLARHFPVRNRLIASLGNGLVVVEAGLRSGSLISAREASERGREVMAIPGAPIDPRAQGCNALIRDGATLVQSAADVIEILRDVELGAAKRRAWTPPPPSQNPAGDAAEVGNACVMLEKVMNYNASEVDELIRQCHLSAAVVHSALLEMELAGKVTRHYGNRVSLVYDDAPDEIETPIAESG